MSTMVRRSLRDILSWTLLVVGAATCVASAVLESPRSRGATMAIAVIVLFVMGATELDRQRHRWRRMRRGHCPRCNYDLRGRIGYGCPECGWRRPPALPAKLSK